MPDKLPVMQGLFAAPGAAPAGIPVDRVFDYRAVGEMEPPVLRGTGECISLAFGAAPASAVTLSISVEWTEE